MTADSMTAPARDPIPKRKLYQAVVDRLMARIMSGELKPGQKLPSERQLMDLYQVGRPAIREAMQTLERQGLITISHGERARVLSPTARSVIDQVAVSTRLLIGAAPENLEHLKDARAFFEEGMVRQAVGRATEADIDTLRGLIRAQEAARHDQAAFLDCDMRFHRQIAYLTGNPIYPALSQAMFQWLAEFHSGVVSMRGAETLTLTEHTRIVDRMAQQDADGAVAAMRDHLRRVDALYRLIETVQTAQPVRGSTG